MLANCWRVGERRGVSSSEEDVGGSVDGVVVATACDFGLALPLGGAVG